MIRAKGEFKRGFASLIKLFPLPLRGRGIKGDGVNAVGN